MFDKRDNCFQASQRAIIKHLNSKGINTQAKKDIITSIEKLTIDYKGIVMIPTNERLTPQLLAKLGIKSYYD